MASPARYDTRSDGYCRWRAWDRADGRKRYFYVHQLTAIAYGASPYLVFSNSEYHIQHRSGIKFDHRPENLGLLKDDDHARETFGQRGAQA